MPFQYELLWVGNIASMHTVLIYSAMILSILTSNIAHSATPAYCTGTHDVGKMRLVVTNGGVFGMLGSVGLTDEPAVWPYEYNESACHLGSVLTPDPIFGATQEYPAASGARQLQAAALWIGGVNWEGDTLVSVAVDGWHVNLELHPNSAPYGELFLRSPASDPLTNSYSDQDYIATFTDTMVSGVIGLTTDYLTRRGHKPLGLSITQTSTVWSSPLADDFVIIEYQVTNVGPEDVKDIYVGVFVDPLDGNLLSGSATYCHSCDDLCGFVHTAQLPNSCAFLDTLNIAWSADNDGDPDTLQEGWVTKGGFRSERSAFGVRFLSVPKSGSGVSFNWWNSSSDPTADYGPYRHSANGQTAPNFGTGGSGTPEGDRSKYYLMSNHEVDFDQPRIPQIMANDSVWEFPTSYARNWLRWGGEIRYCLSTGPFSLESYQTETFVVAFVGAEEFHMDPTNLARLTLGDIDAWYANLNFGNLVKNAKQAEWVYDNPGYDTDGDGYRGKYHVCVIDSVLVDSTWIPSIAETTYYAGDGIPDWRAVGPPPGPKFWLHPYDKGIRVRFNGLLSETTKDLVSNRIDFEGYRIYLGRDDREASLALAAGCDLKNYDKFVWNPKLYPSGGFEVQEVPFTLDQLRCLYGLGNDPCHDSLFDPLAYTASAPYRLPGYLGDSIFYFVQHGYNASRLGVDTPIRKLYPNQPKPIPGEPIPDSAYTEDGYLKYYEYECIIDGLLPTVPYYVNVTAIDYGDPAGGVEALESSKLLGLQDCYALENANQTGATNKPVYIYPNPYRADAKYREMGYEGRGSDRINDRERRIHFANLPAKCWIRIHTLDGDMVREIRHDMDPNDPASDHDTWDLINRNVMAVESGLYYWSVEPDSGPVQIGKLVIIR